MGTFTGRYSNTLWGNYFFTRRRDEPGWAFPRRKLPTDGSTRQSERGCIFSNSAFAWYPAFLYHHTFPITPGVYLCLDQGRRRDP
jgi:hypothetical protein